MNGVSDEGGLIESRTMISRIEDVLLRPDRTFGQASCNAHTDSHTDSHISCHQLSRWQVLLLVVPFASAGKGCLKQTDCIVVMRKRDDIMADCPFQVYNLDLKI